MNELRPSDYRKILPLLAGIKQAVIPDAICEGKNPGRIFVDRYEKPEIAMIWTTVGYYFLAGNPVAENIEHVAQTLLETFIPASQMLGESGYILCTSSPAWDRWIHRLLPGRSPIQIYRRTFTFDQAKFAASATRLKTFPSSYTLCKMDAVLAERAGVLSSWATIQDFIDNGLGFCLMYNDEIASLCNTVFASSQRVEIDVHTEEQFRRQGFAVATASALIQACLEQGRQPNWECFWDNAPSTALAQSLGYDILEDYPVTYWEEETQEIINSQHTCT